MEIIKNKYFVGAIASLASLSAFAQNGGSPRLQTDNNVVTTAVPFLIISPDSRSGGMGDVGVSTSADANSIHWNPAKMSFLEDGANSLGMSYTPWLQQLVPDINLAYISYVRKLDDNQAFGLSFRYFTLGSITYTDQNGATMGEFESNEMSIDGAYSLKLSRNLSAGIALRFIYSALTQGATISTGNTQPGTSFASDISLFYQGDEFLMEGGQSGRFTAGMNISNLGAKIRYTETGRTDFIPTNLRLGAAFTWGLDQYVDIAFVAEANKLLVPTPPIRDDDNTIIAGMDDDVDFFTGVFQSFRDAPGGFSEEMREIVINTGVEMWYDKKFALRTGYQHEALEKGGRQYFTLGLGVRFNVFGLDFSYLIPATRVRNPLENTLRFSLFFDFHKEQSK